MLILWLLAVLFLSPGTLYHSQEEFPRLVMEAVDSLVEPGREWDWEAEQMAEDKVLENTGGVSAGIGAVMEEPSFGQAAEDEAAEASTASSRGDNVHGGTSSVQGGAEQGETGQKGTSPSKEENVGNGDFSTQAAEGNPDGAAEVRPVIGRVYSREELTDFGFLRDQFFIEDETVQASAEVLNGEELLSLDLTFEKKNEPQVLIYHTHSQEEYADSVPGDRSMTVQGLGDILADILEEKYGLEVLHNTEEFDMVEGELERSRAYSYAKESLTQILTEYPTIQVVIDLHRDAVPEELHLVTEVDGKPTAKLMFFNGMSENLDGPLESLPNPYREDNLAFSLQMLLKAEAYYPGLMRGIYLKCYRYNLHLRARSVLVEVGAQNNTYEEAVNAMEPLADILTQVVLSERNALTN